MYVFLPSEKDHELLKCTKDVSKESFTYEFRDCHSSMGQDSGHLGCDTVSFGHVVHDVSEDCGAFLFEV